MTLRNRCVACDQVIEAPDQMRGQETTCDACGAPNVLLGPTDATVRQRAQQAAGARAAASLTLQAGQRLHDSSLYLLGFAYLLLLLTVLLGGALAYAWEGPVAQRAAWFLGCAVVGLLAFVYLKFMSDAVRALADLGRAIESRMSLVVEKLEDMETIDAGEPAKKH